MVCVRSSPARLQPAKKAMVVTSSMTTRLSDIADDVLLSNTKALVKCGQSVTAELLLHLGEVDARRLYLGLAFPSLFAWCVGALGFSEDSAYHHIGVARLARRLPAVLDFLRPQRRRAGDVTHRERPQLDAPPLRVSSTQPCL